MDQLQWSYSSLKDFAGCPKRYHEIKILKNFEFVPTEAILVGQRIHSAIEHYIKDGTPLPKNYLHYKEYIDPILELPGEKMVEHKMALKFDAYSRLPCCPRLASIRSSRRWPTKFSRTGRRWWPLSPTPTCR